MKKNGVTEVSDVVCDVCSVSSWIATELLIGALAAV